jgi:hypothetical protein
MSSLFYSEDGYGTAVEQFLLDTITDAQMSQLIQSELLKDERTQSVSVRWLEGAATITVTSHKGQTFPLTLSISNVGAALDLPETS